MPGRANPDAAKQYFHFATRTHIGCPTSPSLSPGSVEQKIIGSVQYSIINPAGDVRDGSTEATEATDSSIITALTQHGSQMMGAARTDRTRRDAALLRTASRIDLRC